MRPSCGVILCDLVAEKKLNLGYDKKGKEGAGKAKSFEREGRKWKKGGLPCGLCKTHGRHVFAVCFRSSHGKQVSGKKLRPTGNWKEVGNTEILMIVVYLTFPVCFSLSLPWLFFCRVFSFSSTVSPLSAVLPCSASRRDVTNLLNTAGLDFLVVVWEKINIVWHFERR
jgi:hypothetical protein